jgi:hypothetical protein
LLPPGGKLGIDPLNGVRTDPFKALAGTRGQLVQIKAGEPLSRSRKGACRLVAGGVCIIPDAVYLSRSGIEPGIPFSLHFQAQGANAVLNRDRHDSITEVTSVHAGRASVISHAIIKKGGNESGVSQTHLQLAALLHFVAAPFG